MGATPREEKAPARAFRPRRSIRELRRLLGRLRRADRFGDAIPVAEELCQRAPGRKSYFQLGWLYREAGNHRKAIVAFRDALRFKKGPRHLLPEIHLHTAYAWYYLGNRERMGEARKRAYSARSKPRSGHVFHMILGTDFLMRHRPREAFAEYEHAARTAPSPMKRARALVNAGLALVRLGEHERAMRTLDRAEAIQERLRLWTELASTRMVRASLHFDRGQFRRAHGILRRVVKTFRTFGKTAQEAEALQHLGNVANELGITTEGVAALTRAIRIARPNGWWRILTRAHAYRATIYARLELFEGAEEDLVRAASYLRGHRDMRSFMHLARAQARIAAISGDWTEARRAAAHGERAAAGISDLLRVVEFRKLKAEAESELGRSRAALVAWRNASRLEQMIGRLSRRDAGIDVTRLAQTNLPILIVGEMGTGKTALAEQFHRLSARARRRCVRVACEQLVFPESELYGHVRGAWSGATRNELGYARRANGGSLILDRIDELDRRTQRLLIPILERRVRPVGGVDEESIDIRVIAVCRDPARLLPEIRERIDGKTIHVPPLRERRADLPLIAQEILRGRRRLTCDAVAELIEHRWEGNLAELQGVLERLIATTDRVIGRTLVRRVLRTGQTYSVTSSARKVTGSRMRKKTARTEGKSLLPKRQFDSKRFRKLGRATSTLVR